MPDVGPSAPVERGTRVDVGMPTHKRSHYLPQAIESVLAQTHPDVRLTISEDGPGDAAEVVAPYLSDPRVRFVSSGSELLGSAGNHNRLLGMLEGPYVAFLHDDDLWDPEVLARRVAFLEEHPECGFVFSAGTQIDGEGRELGRSQLVLSAGVHQPTEVVPRLLRHNIIGGIHNLLVRRSLYDEAGAAFDERFDFYDWEMHLRLALHAPAGYLPVWDVHYRVHGVQMSVAVLRGARHFDFHDHLNSLVATRLPEAQYTPTERRNLLAHAHVRVALDAAETGRRRDALRELAQAIRVRPRTILQPQAAAIVTAVVFGRRAQRIVSDLRKRSRKRAVRHGAR